MNDDKNGRRCSTTIYSTEREGMTKRREKIVGGNGEEEEGNVCTVQQGGRIF